MTLFATVWDFIVQTLLQEFVVIVFAVLFALTIQRWIEKWRYGNWQVEIREAQKRVLYKNISPGKAKAILEIPEDMSVFLKGLISPFGWLNCDLIDDGPRLGLLNINTKKRIISIDMDKNPSKDDELPDHKN